MFIPKIATTLAVTLFVGCWASLIPMATLAAILVVVCYHMSEWRTFMDELRAPRSDVLVLLTTFTLTLLVDLTVGIGVGMVLAAFLFIRRMSSVTQVSTVTDALADDERDTYDDGPRGDGRRVVPTGVEIYEIHGPFFFGAVEAFRETLGQVARVPRVLVVRMRHVHALDSTGMHVLADLAKRTRQAGSTLILRGPGAATGGALRVASARVHPRRERGAHDRRGAGARAGAGHGARRRRVATPLRFRWRWHRLKICGNRSRPAAVLEETHVTLDPPPARHRHASDAARGGCLQRHHDRPKLQRTRRAPEG